ncbi:MAG: hypothetical protein WD002_07370 [Pseudomonadales bacterium]
MRFAITLVLSIVSWFATAEPELPQSLEAAEPSVIMAAGFGLMNLSDDEKASFGEIIRQFTDDVQKRVQLEARRNAPNLEHRMRRRVNNLFDDLDNRVKPLIDEERLAGYQIFKAGLYRQMQPTGKRADQAAPFVDKGGGRPSAVR